MTSQRIITIASRRPRITYWCSECNEIVEAIIPETDAIKCDYRFNPEASSGYYTQIEVKHTILCSKCDCGMIELDNEIVERIVKLNKLGFNTTYSCQGHISLQHAIHTQDYKMMIDIPYIAFKYDNGTNEYPIKYIYECFAQKAFPYLELQHDENSISIHALTPNIKRTTFESDMLIPYSQDLYKSLTEDIETCKGYLFAFIDSLIVITEKFNKDNNLNKLED